MRPIATDRTVMNMPTGKLAVWWIVVSEIVIFGGLLGGYIMHRLAHDAWSDMSANTSTMLGTINTLILLSSSLSAVIAHHHAEHGDGEKAAKFLWLTVLGALGFIGVKSVEWTTEISHGFTINAGTFWSFYYTAAGIHALHVIAGAIIMVIVAMDARKGKDLHRVELIGIYWHFVDLVWIFLFPLLYIAK